MKTKTKIIITTILLVVIVLHTNFFTANYVQADNTEKANNLYLEWIDWYYNEIFYRLGVQHNVTYSKIVEIIMFLEDHYYFEKEWKEKVVFIQQNSVKYPELRYVGEITNIPSKIEGGTVLEADKRSYWTKLNAQMGAETFSDPNFNPYSAVEKLRDPFISYITRLKPEDKRIFSGRVLEFFYSPDGVLNKYYYKINRNVYPDFSENEVRILKGWAMKKSSEEYIALSASVSGSIQVRGTGAVRVTTKVAGKTKTWKEAIKSLWNKIICKRTVPPNTPDIPMLGNNFQARLWITNGEGSNAKHVVQSFNMAADDFNAVVGKYGWNVESYKLREMSYIGPDKIEVTIGGTKIFADGGYYPKLNKMSFPQDVFFNRSVEMNAHVITHEYLHSAYRGVGLKKLDLVEEGVNEYFCLQIHRNDSFIRYPNETYATSKLFNMIKTKYPNRTLYNMGYLVYSTHDNYNAAQRINALFKNPNEYENLNNLLYSLKEKRYNLQNGGQQYIDNFINNLQLK